MEMKSITKRLLTRIYRPIKRMLIERKTKHITISVPELFFHHNSKNDFLRYDMIVRLLAVENYYDQNDFGFSLYSKMQEARIGKERAKRAVPIFRDLIASYEKNGYDQSSEIELNSNLGLIDGSHRMALAMYYKCETINAKVRPYSTQTYYSLPWFYVNGFTKQECQVLKDKYEELKSSYMTPFICTLWAPAYKYFDEITDKLSLFGRVVGYQDYDLSDFDYTFFTRSIYSVDDIEKWKIEKKIEYMKKSEPSCRKIRMVELQIDEPNFRLKQTYLSTLSQKCELIKKVVREAYKGRINGYYHDIIMHIGDNFAQNRFIYKLLSSRKLDLVDFFSKISNIHYAVTKLDVPYMPITFPRDYPLGKDVDILCPSDEVHDDILGVALVFSKDYEKDYDIRVVSKNGHGYKRTLVRFEQEKQLVFLLDISSQAGNCVAHDFTSDLCATRIETNGLYRASSEFEVLIRLIELYEHPNKQHHLTYIKDHIGELDEAMCDKYLRFKWKSLVQGM